MNVDQAIKEQNKHITAADGLIKKGRRISRNERRKNQALHLRGVLEQVKQIKATQPEPPPVAFLSNA